MKRMGRVTFQKSSLKWNAIYLRQKVTYSEARFGNLAEALAYRALSRMQAGTFDYVSDDLLLKLSWRLEDAAKQLGLSISQLRRWMLTGMIYECELKPPARDVVGVDRISGCELMMAQERLVEFSMNIVAFSGVVAQIDAA